MILYTGITYLTKEKVGGLESHEMTMNNQHMREWPMYAGIGLILIGGIALVLGVNRKDEKEIEESLK
jgi:hypothetical protein